jgi:hypothetical protein
MTNTSTSLTTPVNTGLLYNSSFPLSTDENSSKSSETITEASQKSRIREALSKWAAQRKSESRMILSKKVSLSLDYAPEKQSLELGLYKPGRGQIAIYHKGYNEILEQDKIWIKNPEVSLDEKIMWLKTKKLSPIYYFSEQMLQIFRVDDAKSFEQRTKALSSDVNGNCLIVKEGKIYLYPKRIANYSLKYTSQTIRMGHTSAGIGEPIDFAGTLHHVGGNRWTISNRSGHYITPASKMTACLKAFQNQKIPLENLTIEHWIPVNPRHLQPLLNSSFHICKGKNITFLIKKTEGLEWVKQTSKLQCSKKRLSPCQATCCTIS